MNTAAGELAKILNVPEPLLDELNEKMSRATGRIGVLDKVLSENHHSLEKILTVLEYDDGEAEEVYRKLEAMVRRQEKVLLEYLGRRPEEGRFRKAAALASEIADIGRGHFLKKENAKKILLERPPQNLMSYLGYTAIDDLVAKEDLLECFSALRFIESTEWMHETFEKTYSSFTKDDFEERGVEIKVLGDKWHEIAMKFVAKKHHNVSHLKEFGIIFLNPIAEDVPGKFIRDFALLFHYFHEVQFYSKLFAKYFNSENFARHFKSLLRGDVKEAAAAEAASGSTEWLIIQRYLAKDNPRDSRLFLPHVNPESMHWARGEKDLANFAGRENISDIQFWGNLDWVGGFFSSEGGSASGGRRGGGEAFISFDLEDNAMSEVSEKEGPGEFFTYHQKEALWTKLFSEYAGGEEAMERLLIENFEKGSIKF